MYINMHGAIQKYMLAVDDILPLTQEGGNLFCQVDKGYNVVLPFLEKAWAKYVHLTEIRDSIRNDIYIDRIMLAFLGSPSIRLSTSHPNFRSEFKKHFFDGSYTFCFVKETCKQKLPENHRPMKPYHLKYVCEFDFGGKTKHKIYFMQADESGGGLGSIISDKLKDFLMNKPLLKCWVESTNHEQGLFLKEEAEFLELFDKIFICTYQKDEICRHHTASYPMGSIEGGKFDVGSHNLGILLQFPVPNQRCCPNHCCPGSPIQERSDSTSKGEPSNQGHPGTKADLGGQRKRATEETLPRAKRRSSGQQAKGC